MVELNLTISIITLNLNELNTPIKRQWLPLHIKKQDPTIHFFQESNMKYNDTERLKIKNWKRCNKHLDSEPWTE